MTGAPWVDPNHAVLHPFRGLHLIIKNCDLKYKKDKLWRETKTNQKERVQQKKEQWALAKNVKTLTDGTQP